MIRIERPPRPDDFEDKVAADRARVAVSAEGEGELSFPNRWNAWKEAFGAKHHHKCGYCEMKLTSLGQLDHFAPKGGVKTGRAVEDPETRKTTERIDGPVFERGYHWKAYDWDNYVLSCERCNVGFKRQFFPVAPIRRGQPRPECEETPLLLNPYEGPDPAVHLSFDATGGVSPIDESCFGTATIETVGLDRQLLQEERREIAKLVEPRIKSFARRIKNADEDDDKAVIEALAGLVKLGAPAKRHAAVTRALIAHHAELTWDTLAGFVESL